MKRKRGSNAIDDFFLLRAARRKQLSRVQALLLSAREEDAANVNAIDANGKTPFHHACCDNNKLDGNSSLEIIKLLLENGANINAKDDYDRTPLHCASVDNCRNNLEVAKFLLENGADVNARNNSGATPFNDTCRYGQGPYLLEILMLLIEKGADVNAQDNRGKTPLHSACHRGDLKMFKILIQNGADDSIPMMIVTGICISDSDDDNELPKRNREYSRPVQTLMTDLRDHNANGHDNNQYRLPPLHWACLHELFDMVQLLIENGGGGDDGEVDVLQAKDEYGMTPLHWVCYLGLLEMVKFLVSHGAKANVKSKKGWTPLHFACNENHLEVVRFLVRQDPSLVLPSSGPGA